LAAFSLSDDDSAGDAGDRALLEYGVRARDPWTWGLEKGVTRRGIFFWDVLIVGDGADVLFVFRARRGHAFHSGGCRVKLFLMTSAHIKRRQLQLKYWPTLCDTHVPAISKNFI
jgi:hypothetical protein